MLEMSLDIGDGMLCKSGKPLKSICPFGRKSYRTNS